MRSKNRWYWILLILAVVLLVFLLEVFCYYPQYRGEQAPIHVSVENDGKIRLMSQNIRHLTLLDLGERSWFYRAGMITDTIREESPGIIGFQEVTRWQYDYLAQMLTEYDSVLQFQDDSTFSEGCPIFYYRDLYTMTEEGSFWLSDTPEVMSKSWESDEYRICSYVVLQDKQTRKQFTVFNTHFDHVSDEVKVNGMQVILDKIRQMGDIPFVIMGDLSEWKAPPDYQMEEEYCLDAFYVAEKMTDGPTYQAWGEPKNSRRTDCFLVAPEGVDVTRYAVVSAEQDGIYCSDHNAIVMEMTLDRIRIMSHNLRLSSSKDKGNIRWFLRRPLVQMDIDRENPDVIGLQEVTRPQYEDLVTMLPEYDSVMVYRSDSETAEGCPIFYNRSRFALKESNTFWLSETPEVMSKGWDAKYYRICTYVILTEKRTGVDFAVFNLHLDHISEAARMGGLEVIFNKTACLGDMPHILLGDFNALEDSDVYRRVTENYLDARYETENTSDAVTYQIWGDLENGRRIDFFILSPEDFTVYRYHVLPGVHGGLYSSDHSPIVMDATVRRENILQ